MPTNPLKYPLNFGYATRPQILKRDGYKCTKCGIPNHIRYIREANDTWREADSIVLQYAKERKIKVSKAVLTIAHLNHLTFDNRPENLKTMCGSCHLKHDRKHKIEMARFAQFWDAKEVARHISAPGGEKYLNHALEVAKVLGRRYQTLRQIYDKRHVKGYDSQYDRDILKESKKLKSLRRDLITAIAMRFEDLYEIPDSFPFIETFLNNENRLIGIKKSK